jgi:hypothetical protein
VTTAVYFWRVFFLRLVLKITQLVEQQLLVFRWFVVVLSPRDFKRRRLKNLHFFFFQLSGVLDNCFGFLIDRRTSDSCRKIVVFLLSIECMKRHVSC